MKAELFSLFVRQAARMGPSAKIWRSVDEYQEAISNITWQTKCQVYNRQTACSHQKGGKFRPLTLKDHAVTTHTFIDSRTRIKCVLCGLEAWSNSGMDFKFAYMQSLAESSTNHPSASEQVLLQVTQGKTVLATFPNTDSGRAALRKAYPHWNGEFDQPFYEPPKEDSGLGIPEGHSPIKGVEASTPEAGPDAPNAIIVTSFDDLFYAKPYTESK